MYTLFVEIQRYLEIPRIHFCETSHSRRQAPKVSVVKSISKENAEIRFRAKPIVMLLSRDIYCQRAASRRYKGVRRQPNRAVQDCSRGRKNLELR